MQIDFIFSIAVLIVSVILHEVSHGYTANFLGDPTAKYAGRLTLNPLKHLDMFGSVLLPILTYLGGGFILGWAKPVPFNPYNLRNQKWGPAIVGAAGPLSNLTVVVIFSAIIRSAPFFNFLPVSFFKIASIVVFINLMLAIFNLIPLPPLDGSKVLSVILPYKWQSIQFILEKYAFFFVLIFLFFIWPYIFSPVVIGLFRLFTGII